MSAMRKPLLVLALLGAAAAAAMPAAELVEQIVARVNDVLITQSEFDRRVALAEKASHSTTNVEELKKTVLEDMIREKLLEERAREASVSATDEEVQAAVARVKAQYNFTTDEAFDASLAQSGMTRDDLKRQMKQTITLQKVIGRDVASKLDLTDDTLRLEYERQKEKLYAIPESARVSEIVLSFPASDPEARQQAVAKIEEARARIKSGTPFADLAKELSEGITRDKGGELGVVNKGELMEALDVVIFATPVAEYPPPAILPTSIHLFRVTDFHPAGFKPFSEVKEDLRRRISDDLYEKRFAEYLDKLRRDAYVKIYDADLAKLEEKKGT